jgi:hypothetical protein
MRDKSVALMGPRTIDAGQYFDIFRGREQLAPERALVLALLEDAIHCYRQYRGAHDRAGRHKFSEAEKWITRQGRDWVFTFDNVCELLGLDPQYVRRGLIECEKNYAHTGEGPRSSVPAPANSLTGNGKTSRSAGLCRV